MGKILLEPDDFLKGGLSQLGAEGQPTDIEVTGAKYIINPAKEGSDYGDRVMFELSYKNLQPDDFHGDKDRTERWGVGPTKFYMPSDPDGEAIEIVEDPGEGETARTNISDQCGLAKLVGSLANCGFSKDDRRKFSDDARMLIGYQLKFGRVPIGGSFGKFKDKAGVEQDRTMGVVTKIIAKAGEKKASTAAPAAKPAAGKTAAPASTQAEAPAPKAEANGSLPDLDIMTRRVVATIALKEKSPFALNEKKALIKTTIEKLWGARPANEMVKLINGVANNSAAVEAMAADELIALADGKISSAGEFTEMAAAE